MKHFYLLLILISYFVLTTPIFDRIRFNSSKMISKSEQQTGRLNQTKIEGRFEEIKLPGSDQKVLIRRLGQASDGSEWTVVKFPKGYYRKDSVYLGVDEGYYMVDGELQYRAASSPKETYSLIPARVARVETRANEPVTAIARFSGKPVWVEKNAIRLTQSIQVSALPSTHLSEGPLGLWYLFMKHGLVEVGFMKNISTRKAHPTMIVFSKADSTIVEVLKNEPIPKLKGPFVIWTTRDE